MAMPPKYTFGEFVRDFLTTAGHFGTCAVAYAISKDQPMLAAAVFIVGTAGTRGIRKEVQARLLSVAAAGIKSLEANMKDGDGDDK